MDDLLEYVKDHEEIFFFVSLDYNIDGYQTEQEYYSCEQWADLYIELGEYGNIPLIINGDPDHRMWHMFSGTAYSAYAFIDHHMVVRYLLDSPNLDDFKYEYIPSLINSMYGCTDPIACNYKVSAVYDNGICLYQSDCGDLNFDNKIDIYDIILLISLILSNSYDYIADMNTDNNLNLFDITELLLIILE
tara:strand:+ start:940 stop:1509 length:570 start_codon:yes stop_codon:yes gene_type:complete